MHMFIKHFVLFIINIFLIFVLFMPIDCFSMMTLNEARCLYPEYNKMTDYKFLVTIHKKIYPDIPFNFFIEEVYGARKENYKHTIPTHEDCPSIVTLEKFRIIFPQYNDLSDYELAIAIHEKWYTDISFDDFVKQFQGGTQIQGATQNNSDMQIENKIEYYENIINDLNM